MQLGGLGAGQEAAAAEDRVGLAEGDQALRALPQPVVS